MDTLVWVDRMAFFSLYVSTLMLRNQWKLLEHILSRYHCHEAAPDAPTRNCRERMRSRVYIVETSQLALRFLVLVYKIILHQGSKTTTDGVPYLMGGQQDYCRRCFRVPRLKHPRRIGLHETMMRTILSDSESPMTAPSPCHW